MQHLRKKYATSGAAVGLAARRIVGANVRSVRKTHGWTQVELGQRIGMGQGTISAIERGERCPSLPTLFLLAQVCEVATGRLVQVPDDADGWIAEPLG